MKFEDAKQQIRNLFPDARLISFKFEIDDWLVGSVHHNTIKCVAIVCHGHETKGTPFSSYFDAETWQGVIDKIRIHLLPKGESSMEESPEEPEVVDGKNA